ncbi:heavy-metal-associated domain-containing protein [Luteirhabdus pelagi]|uniref:heavy-metal-associated domain-containing protein n=1 Tax=Luteirhabdus pelagi TaxID=2792783 RepID=UPI00193AD5F6|nr:heavy metal-associated domain-containing protein [Luteirhabdus pelagi]
MTHTYNISGMTCKGCKASVEKNLNALAEVTDVDVDLQAGEAIITSNQHISLSLLQKALPSKYTISEKETQKTISSFSDAGEEKSKWQQLQPLFLIFAYIATASILLHIEEWNTQAAMLDFMGLFYIVFSFFKMLDLKGFPQSFQMYDPLAKAVPAYGKIYPFIETALGILFLMRIEVKIALIVTIIILGITTIGVVRTLLDKKKIKCACLGTALNLPMTEATFIENAVMIIMALTLLFNLA